MPRKRIFFLLVTLILYWHLFPSFSNAEEKTQGIVDLRILETTDLHADLVNYDYYQTQTDHRVGLVKTATLIHQARKETKNSLLFDVGDHLKGNPLGEYLARIRGMHKGKVHPVYRAFNYLAYDAIAIGNHEFNYGLKFLNVALKGANMPVINANVYSVKKNKPYFMPYVILKRNVVDLSGAHHELKVGVIGFMPTQIMSWDRANLEGKVFAKPIVDAAKEFVPAMKAEGADIIIALAHTGISNEPYNPDTENAVYYLTQIPGIDAILAGHSHSVFPGPVYEKLPNTNIDTGEINGKPVVMAGAFGNRLGIIDLQIEYTAGKWKVVKGTSLTRSIADENGKPLVKKDKRLFKLVKPEHEETVDFIRKIGL
ncbi:2',3'-cyclic-nucleotide 2'-phosphodiesterase/3'-nucleotidase [Neobacillus rhizosphaerae]|uniref:2',3'-cyclic-nucleotide 2'-phosphodiesterase/3'-nucleotidase n=1 Tax=Neobacillus rhizosphaerae TaxID=2880965 RepID=A0ABM9EM32_9BACI|nr:metallophosphoesterase [Neobacillus rhizosphaerae]CAH2713656.1 2',3'-cyclic-nucleotide 2'-phosphodiesterase/3'-nucleotidase [Neobacillus rhizosphaerae]